MIEEINDVVENIKAFIVNAHFENLDEKIYFQNEIKKILHDESPFKNEPVDCVLWKNINLVKSNDYNPNTVAPPEMELLKVSILHDGYTQPIVTWKTDEDDIREVVDGFHRNRVARECKEVNERVLGYLPVVTIREEQGDRNNRIASTIRHNRARGKHNVESMSDIVIELKRRNWTNERIMRELGMDEDEILRLCQITGLADLFSDHQFSAAWEVDGFVDEDDFEELTDEVDEEEAEKEKFRSVNTSDENRIFHTFDKWECYKAGFYDTKVDGMSKEEAEKEYARFLSNDYEFRIALNGVITEWKNSCEHYLTNVAMNRIAWLGQASACYSLHIPSKYRSGFSLLKESQQNRANEIALEFLNLWLVKNNMQKVSMEEATSGSRQSDIY